MTNPEQKGRNLVAFDPYERPRKEWKSRPPRSRLNLPLTGKACCLQMHQHAVGKIVTVKASKNRTLQ